MRFDIYFDVVFFVVLHFVGDHVRVPLFNGSDSPSLDFLLSSHLVAILIVLVIRLFKIFAKEARIRLCKSVLNLLSGKVFWSVKNSFNAWLVVQ